MCGRSRRITTCSEMRAPSLFSGIIHCNCIRFWEHAKRKAHDATAHSSSNSTFTSSSWQLTATTRAPIIEPSSSILASQCRDKRREKTTSIWNTLDALAHVKPVCIKFDTIAAASTALPPPPPPLDFFCCHTVHAWERRQQHQSRFQGA